MKWRQAFVAAMAGRESRPEFSQGASLSVLEDLSKKLKGSVSKDLLDLLQEADGVNSVMTLEREEIVTGWLIWPTATIASEARAASKIASRHHNLPLAFFAPGDVVTFAIDTDGKVFAWYPIEACLEPVASTLMEFVHGWCSGSLSV